MSTVNIQAHTVSPVTVNRTFVVAAVGSLEFDAYVVLKDPVEPSNPSALYALSIHDEDASSLEVGSRVKLQPSGQDGFVYIVR